MWYPYVPVSRWKNFRKLTASHDFPAADFRSSSGLYAKLQQEGKYDLDDPQQMYVANLARATKKLTWNVTRFDIDYFKLYPEVF